VVATDVAGNASEQVVSVAINNLDEVAPSITSGDTATAIDENSGSGQVVYTATADDSLDTSDGVTFSLADEALGFSIDADGVVTTNDDFAADYENAQSQSFTVVATDGAGNASEQVVSVAINNLDEVAPSITSGDTADAIDENSGSGQVVYTATADDSLDTSDGVTFSLTDSDPALFIDSLTGEVTLMDNPDYETQSFYSFTVVATDAAGNESFPQSVTLDINNLDEVAPSITSSTTADAIDENSGSGQVVYTATADDSLDTSDGVTFSLTDSDPALFIDSLTGEVTLMDNPDYEAQDFYSFTVVATDAAGNESEQYVTLDINNLDEVAPSITSGDTATAIDENSGEGQVVYTATASDTDFNGLEDITFSLADNSLGFSIDADTGVVTTNADFAADYENAQSQSFTVVATDVAGNASEQVVNVAINNLDEIAPSITSGDTGTAVNENSGADQVGYTATASDTDFNGAEDITFSLADDSLGFSIDASTGVVTTNTDFESNFEDAQSQSFTVVATDAAGNATEQVVSVAINNLDEVAPSITSGDTGTAVNENSGADQVVYTATATDDADTSDGFSFSLADDSLGFSIDASTGVVTTNADFAADYENTQSQSFTVVATDAAGNASEQVVSVAINNLDEVAPSITSGDTGTAVNENSGADQVVYTATASDTDFNGLEDITFSLADESLGFSIDADTGVVTTNADFAADYEDAQSQSFTVVATDATGNFSEQFVNVAINNLDEVAPSITSGDTATAVDENSGASQVIYTATATDDADTSAGVTFSLTGDSDPALSIDPSTGAVTLSADPDHETQSQYSFTVVASDGVNEAVEQSVTLDINNLDEIAPSITSGDTAVAIDENSGASQVIYTATATDDADTSAGVTFSLTGDSDPALSIDPSTGAVTLSADADHETQSQYSFTVVASDGVNEAVEQSVTLDINNLDEIAPSITSGDTAVAIDENTGADTVIYTAIADDSLDISAGVIFSLTGDSDPALSIDPSTGAVTLSADPDHETQSQYSFTVVASDGVNEAVEQSVTLDINNLDEIAPSITSGDIAVAIDENTGASQVIYTATATDDADTSAGVTFSLTGDSDPALSIDPSTGAVTLSADPNHETQSQYSFTVVASDGVNGDVEQSVTLDINNLDEIAPFITSSATAVAIDENSGEGQVVYTATAYDSADTSDGVTFSLVGTDAAAFTINEDSGEVTLIANPDHESQSEYNFTVVATDGAGNASEKLVSLAINNLDEVAPSITSGDTATAIDENSGEGQVVYTATATDDADISDGFAFSLADDSLGFSIDADTGVVTTNANFAADYENAESQSFTVVVTDAAGNASEQVVSVAINNLDEVAPSITSGDTATAIDENSGADQVVYTATASDTDFNGLEDITFSLADDSLGFSIDASTGVVTTNADFAADYEDAQSQSFTVVATDAAGNASEQVVSVAINNLDEVAPSITSGDTGTAVNENSGADQVVYTATASDTDFNGLEDITFSLADESLGFSIDADTGVVTTNADFAANYEDAQSQSFTVVATDVAGNASDQVVSVAINNLDEVAPTITSGETAAVLESSGADTVVYRALVDDTADISEGVTFSLAEGSDPALSIDVTTGEVTLTDEPDFAIKPSYSFTVIADDGVNQSQKAVTLSVVDEDLEAPVFTSSATVAIDENIGEKQVIYTAVTEDESLVTYSLSEDSDTDLSIDSDTGAVKLNTNPDHESQSEYSFTVIAADIANNVSQQAVNVSVNDLDDAAPTITSGATAIAIDENSGSSQVVYTASADDTADISDGVTFSLTYDSDPALSIDPSTGKVTLTSDPDYETQSQYSFAVIATDAAGNESDAQSVTLDINNLDDAAPSITSGDTATAIDENSGASQVVYTATADDSGDEVSDTPITFSLTSDSDTALTIDPSTGVVTLNTDPDHETQSQYSFAVIATDAAGNESNAQSVTLNVNDLDDAAPTITSDATATSIDENSGAGQIIYTATADDSSDDVSDTPITFSLADGSDNALSIDSLTGEVTLSSDPDYEVQASYNFDVLATDAAGNVSAQQVVSVAINNLDEVAPSITSGDTATAIDENSGSGQVVYTATADDSLDTSDGVTFSLADEALGFSIDADGVVTTNDDFAADYENAQSQSFTVVATDGAGNASEQVVSVAINNLDEVAPSITSSTTADAIDENSGSGQVVYTATADDSLDTSDGVTFSLTDSDPALFIDSLTGEVTLMDNPDYEAQDFYSFTVVATDAAGNESFPQSVTLDINNLDEVAPSITSSTTVDAIDENSGSGQVVYTATADDSGDEVSDTPITFSLTSDSDPALFIDSLTGEVTLMDNPDYETQSFYSFTVVATDAAGNESFPQSVTLDINNLDEVAPSITSSTTADAIDENSGSGQVVYTATADDSLDTSDGVTFSLTDSDPALFIDSLTGEVTLMDNPDYEAQDFYSFTVVATDAAGNESFPQSVTLDINNLDEVAPSITSGDTATAIDENSGAGQVVYTATADDSLDTSNGFSFSLADESLGFSIESDTGVVITNDDFAADYEDAQSQSFTVVATDVAGNASQQLVNVAINNLDEVAPVINSGDTATAIDENSGEGQIVYTATATDNADTSDGFSFSLANESLGFSIDASTGVVTTNDDFTADYEDAQSQSFTVVATDVAGNASEQVVSVEINNLDEVAPSITSSTTADAIDENSGAGQVVYTATADDSLDTSDGVIFSLTDSDPALSIDSQTGDVTLTTDPDYETQSFYSFTVVATDAAGNESFPQSVSLEINNLDEVAPSITSSTTADAIDENSGAGQVVYTATADDSLDTSDGVTFSLADDSDPALFIDSLTGEVTLTTDPDYETQSFYSFTVIATDAAGNESFPQSVSLEINNLDEVAPTITSDYSAGSIDENSGSYQLVYTATADDSLDTSDGVTFSLADDSDPALFIDSLTGEVTLIDNPDYELQDFYSFYVIATDAAGNESEQYVTLDINNLDEVAPSIDSGDTATAIDENSGASQVVYTATADDSLDTSNGFSFSLADDSLGFSIDADTGVVTTNADFAADYENAQSQSFTVVAYGCGR
jgi:hypothetical protein